MADKKGGKEKSAKHKKSEFYSTGSEKIERKNVFCPKCGSGIFMAEHKDRQTCGNCGFTQWKNK